MTTPFYQEAAEAALEVVSGSAGTAVTFHRGESSVEVTALIGRTEVESASGDGTMVLSQVRDFIILAADLVIEVDGEDAQIEPKEGDLITEQRGGRVFTYQVFQVGGEVFRWVGVAETYLRIHAKHIKTEAAEE